MISNLDLRWFGLILLCWVAGCSPSQRVEAPVLVNAVEVAPTPQLDALASERRELRFAAEDGVVLAGELTMPRGVARPPLVVIIHHSGPVTRDAYGYMAELLVADGFAVFRFDKRGTGASGGRYGCCEAADALAAYRAAVAEVGINRCATLLVAQSLGTQLVAERFNDYLATTPPLGIALLSNLLGPQEIATLSVPIQIIIAANETDRDRIGPQALAAHQAHQSAGASLYLAEGAEHSLFDVRDGPIDWMDPAWVTRYHRGAMDSLRAWLRERVATAGACGAA
ncbi:MAG: alpha/beta hydrolase [Oscillochloridaceae bacterium umkhey_bin13]